jgi:hypothetical protein
MALQQHFAHTGEQTKVRINLKSIPLRRDHVGDRAGSGALIELVARFTFMRGFRVDRPQRGV